MSEAKTWDLDSTYEQMLLFYAGYKHCKEQREALMLCRATPYGRYVHPEHCEKQAANLLECFNQTANRAKRECAQKYNEALQCLKKHRISKWTNASKGVCSKAFKDFGKC
eukprot:TRINITY_DN1613_c0_g1_i1.p1 TRINITY_DN1613_c0_g1~~TRINITY_DN1613_c0_g1_i1.p1  ORF type:complete len:110 (+),score=29.52 TRINITY_DN1613_c0_g1_i1:155-484(+)